MCIRVEADSALAGEAALAEAFEAGASGAQESEAAGLLKWLLYAPSVLAPAVCRALASHAPGVRAASPEAVPDTDWAERWKQGLKAVSVSPRLRVRPSFVEAEPLAGQAELVIDPGQAFGTGGHASTLLALEWIDALAPDALADARVLDVGCGTGVLALAALRLGARFCVAIDLDPLAARATRQNAAANGLAARSHVVLGALESVGVGGFEIVVANLLRSEMLPLLPGIAQRTAAAGRVVLSGLLAGEVEAVLEAGGALGIALEKRREQLDANGDCWVGLLMRR